MNNILYPSSKKKIIFLCAGGTGGHIFPAHALGSELQRRGFQVHLVFDKRASRFLTDFPASFYHKIPSASLSLKSPTKIIKNILILAKGLFLARQLLISIKPDVVVGFGGYPTIPPLLMAVFIKIPTLIHEANCIFGRANGLLQKLVNVVATGMPMEDWMIKNKTKKFIYTGNPVRDSVHTIANQPYRVSSNNEPFYITILGGSQGAQYFSSCIPKAINNLSHSLRTRLRITQQVCLNDKYNLTKIYEKMGITADISSFFQDIPEHIARSQLVICRAGASTLAEIASIGRPAILIPYPHSIDHDQMANATFLTKDGGGWVVRQDEASPEWFTNKLTTLMTSNSLLKEAAYKAKSKGKLESIHLLANAVECLATGLKVDKNNILTSHYTK